MPQQGGQGTCITGQSPHRDRRILAVITRLPAGPVAEEEVEAGVWLPRPGRYRVTRYGPHIKGSDMASSAARNRCRCASDEPAATVMPARQPQASSRIATPSGNLSVRNNMG
jgi:hypothetical protein